jgi:uncharacterized membrane protein YfcA
LTIGLFTVLVWCGSFVAGLLGALTGLGGGVVIVPLLTLAFDIDIRYAAGASLVSVIATSSGAAAAYVREGYSNVRIGMLLEIATTLGALVGAHAAGIVSTSVIAIVFGAVLIFSALFARHPDVVPEPGAVPDRLATILRLDSDYPTPVGRVAYHVHCVPLGFALMGCAGVLSGLLGIGSGAVKVLAMDRAMRLPFKVSTTTSNFMIGVTAAAGAGVYLNKGYIDPGLALPVMLGVLPGALFGARILGGAKAEALRLVFALVIAALGVQMIYNGWTGRL